MPEKYSYGLTSGKTGTIDPATGLGTAMVDMGSIYKDTLEMMDADIQQTPHYAQQDPKNPKIILNAGAGTTFKFSLMDTSADNMAKYAGGTVTTVSTVKTWNEPAQVPNIELPFEFITSDGTKIEAPRCSVTAKKNFKFSDSGLMLLDITATILSSKVSGVKALRISDPATA